MKNNVIKGPWNPECEFHEESKICSVCVFNYVKPEKQKWDWPSSLILRLIIILTILGLSTLMGCSNFPVKRIGMVHDYIIWKAEKLCKNHGELHYIISEFTISNEKNYCNVNYKFRCQDHTIINYLEGIGWCGISEYQLEESGTK